jgi:GR25 family glycosyltransferase involved in LPS biosynthesis
MGTKKDKKLKPWTPGWVIQRVASVIRERRMPQISLRYLLFQWSPTRKLFFGTQVIDKSFSLQQDDFEDDVFNFRPGIEYDPMVINENADPGSLSLLNQYFSHIYVLNLDRRLDRRMEIIQKLKKYNIRAEIFRAEDGYTPENQEEFSQFFSKPVAGPGSHELEKSLLKKMIASPGAWGYLKTYRRLLQDARQKKYSRILCFDDDVLFHHQFEEKLEKALAQVPADWKLLYLGATQHVWNIPTALDYPVEWEKTDKTTLPYYFPLKADGSFALGIHHSVFDELLEEAGRMDCAFDSGALRSMQQKYKGQCFVVTPNVIIADVSQSDIAHDRRQESLSKKLKWELPEYDYPFRQELVSVIMPAFNAEKTIEKSIRSILLQTYKELEIIVGDDGSSDSTPDIVGRLAKEDSRVRLVRLESNMGCYPARNAALRASQGKYIAIHDSDDVSLSTRIAAQLIPLVTGKALFTLSRVFRGRCTIDELDIQNQREMIRLVLSRRQKTDAGLYPYRDKPIIGFMTSMFTRSLFEELGLFWENRFGSDAEFLERVLYHKAGILLTEKDGTVHSWLMNRKSVPGIYERIDKVQLISADMTGDNITNRTSQQQKEEFEKTWRKRLRGEIHYEYPKF